MKKSYGYLSCALLVASLGACDEYLNTEPQTILTDEQVWSNPSMILGVMADYYGLLPDYLNFESGLGTWGSYDEGLYSGITNTDQVNGILEYGYGTFANWSGGTSSYGLIRNINLAIDKITEATGPQMTPQLKAQLVAELRFMRAWVYFDHVKRHGGVPLITEQLIYDFSGDPTYLQVPRATEAQVYEFIANEMDQIADQLGNEGSQTRANRYTALALKSRAMLYAGSIAEHNNKMPSPITLPGGEVGIPANRAAEFYQKSLDASRAIIQSGQYSLYNAVPNDPGLNFYQALAVKSGNSEVIWAKDYLASSGASHLWTLNMIPPSMRIAITGTSQGAALSPSLQLVETFDYTDGRDGVLPGVRGPGEGQDAWIFYDEIDDIFEGKDGRLWGSIIYPGTVARGQQIQLQAGVYVWNPNTNQYDKVEGLRGSTYTDGGVLTGLDGPRGVENYLTTTGFYVRKYLDEKPEGATSTVGSDIWWVRFRLGEIYLNAAEAAFALGLTDEALGYLNELRERAGFPPNSLTAADLTLEKIQDERRAELSFEDHRIWDIKRWRIAHILWDGSDGSTTANLWSLYPYRVVHPGHPNDGKFVFDKFPSVRQTAPRYFRLGNYYSEIPAQVRGNNPLIVPNPFH